MTDQQCKVPAAGATYAGRCILTFVILEDSCARPFSGRHVSSSARSSANRVSSVLTLAKVATGEAEQFGGLLSLDMAWCYSSSRVAQHPPFDSNASWPNRT